ncbi:MAG: dienelactone hydrolase family protein [Chloroflexota bacterium]|nr:dienelactone hydrolase family protein [Chloroflexota bacterium]
MASRDTGHVNDMQRYLVEEEAEKWQEGRISRREFVRRATLILGSAVVAGPVLLAMGCDPNTPEPTPTTSSASQPSTPQPAASPDATAQATATIGAAATTGATSGSPFHVPEGDPNVRAEMVEIPVADGTRLKAYLALPTPVNARIMTPPGVLVIHENRGLTDHIKDVTRRLARANYAALAVDLLSRQGGSEAHPDEGERTGLLGQNPPEQIISDLSAGLDYLKSRNDVVPDKLGAVGFCFGGGYTWRMATVRPDLKAAVPYYGPNPPLEDVPNIKAAVLGIYGERDTRITGQVPPLEEALKQAGVTYEIKIYEGAEHAFHNDTSARYNPDAAKDAWEQTLAWFEKYLRGT